ncbi:MAG TPA: chemotaxis protein CheW [Kofleriaceae bacterium]|jgi:purine-binding chemotaxis protein CheW
MAAPLHVTFRVGATSYAVPASEVLHLDSFESATPVPGAPPYVAGLVHVRGRLVPVIDLRVRFGLPAVPHELDHRVVVVQHGARVVGLLVDSAREVIAIDTTAAEPPPEIVRAEAGGFVRAVVTVAKRLFLLIDVPRILGEEHSDGESHD